MRSFVWFLFLITSLVMFINGVLYFTTHKLALPVGVWFIALGVWALSLLFLWASHRSSSNS